MRNIVQENTDLTNLVIQLRGSIDLNGNRVIEFQSGEKEVIPVGVMQSFLDRYYLLKPRDREEMQSQAIKSRVDFYGVIYNFHRNPAPVSIYS